MQIYFILRLIIWFYLYSLIEQTKKILQLPYVENNTTSEQIISHKMSYSASGVAEGTDIKKIFVFNINMLHRICLPTAYWKHLIV